MPFLINGFIKPHFGPKFDSQLKSYYYFSYIILNMDSRSSNIFKLHTLLLRFLKLEVEAIELLDLIIRDLHVTID
jgi:hypothetical protein